jgi:hypothetical protein
MSEIALDAGGVHRFRRRALLLVAATAAAAAAALVGLTLSDRGGSTAWAAALVRVAQTAPRLLVDTPGWHVVRADEFGVGRGEMTFADGARHLDLHWERGADPGAKLGDPGSGAESLGSTTVEGTEARLFRYTGSDDYVAVWSHGGYGLQARGVASTSQRSRLWFARCTRLASTRGCRRCRRASSSRRGRSKVVLDLLDGVPLPPGFDVATLLRANDGAVLDRYRLGAKVAGTVACAWLDRWVAARRGGDGGGIRQAVGGSRHRTTGASYTTCMLKAITLVSSGSSRTPPRATPRSLRERRSRSRAVTPMRSGAPRRNRIRPEVRGRAGRPGCRKARCWS